MISPASLGVSSSSFAGPEESEGAFPLKAALLALGFLGTALYLLARRTRTLKSCSATPHRALSTPSLRQQTEKASHAAVRTIGSKKQSTQVERRPAQLKTKPTHSRHRQTSNAGNAAVRKANKPRPAKLVRQPNLKNSDWTIVCRRRKNKQTEKSEQNTAQPQAQSSSSLHRKADRASNADAQPKKLSAQSPRPGKPADDGWTTVQKRRRKKNRRPSLIAELKKKYGTLAYILYKKKWWPEKFGNPTTFFRNWMNDVQTLFERMPYHTDRSQACAKLARLLNQLELPDQYKPDNQHLTTYKYPIDKTLLEINIPWQQLHELAKQLTLIEGVAPAKKKKSS